MLKSAFGILCLGLALSGSAIGCGDDSPAEDDDVEIETPGVDVEVEKLGPAGSGATAPAKPAAQ